MDENKKEKKVKKRAPARLRLALLIAVVVIDALLIAETVYSNTHISVDNYEYESEKVPQSFDGFRIVHISDYHRHGDGFEQKLVELVSQQQPDIIVLTGDMVDSQLTSIDDTMMFFEDISKVAPCYLVWGNHDMRLTKKQREKLTTCCEENGIEIVEDKAVDIEKGGERITVAGSYGYIVPMRELSQKLEESPFVIWLNHFPEDAERILGYKAAYVDENGELVCEPYADLMFCGHAHGGLIRFPFKDGIYAPGQGLFPKYTGGEYYFYRGEMIVSRGMGNSGTSLRLFDDFDLVVCTLKSKE